MGSLGVSNPLEGACPLLICSKLNRMGGLSVQFRDRAEAGALLGRRLQQETWDDPIVLALPRGGVPVAECVADAIGGELGVVVTRKICAPHNRELAIGAVDADGRMFIDSRIVQALAVDDSYIRAETSRQLQEIERRMAEYCENGDVPNRKARDVVLVDDGIATGYTILAAARYVRRHGPARTVIATPVCPPDVFSKLQEEADMVVSLLLPAHFIAVGQFYEDFSQVSDADVRNILTRVHTKGSC